MRRVRKSSIEILVQDVKNDQKNKLNSFFKLQYVEAI